jgi:hypothetical protein
VSRASSVEAVTPISLHPRAINLTGQRFGRLRVLFPINSREGVVWRCICDCGNHHNARAGHLRAGHVQSCGCAQQDAGRITGKLYGHLQRRHGKEPINFYWKWKGMRQRCLNPKNPRYEDYGGHGIFICREWDSYEAFRDWALAEGWVNGLQIDQIDNDGSYTPDNYRFVEQKENVNNTRKNRFLTWQGKTQTIAQWASQIGVAQKTLQHRVARGWDIDRIFTQPFRGHQ